MLWLDSVQVQGAVQDTNNPCSYTILASSAATCGCSPFCDGKNCGPDGCGGFCGGLSGGCPNPSQYTCTIDQICGFCFLYLGALPSCFRFVGFHECVFFACESGCKPDCTFRQCGPDNCGGSCGNCSVGYQCNELQQCGALNIPSASFSVPPITPSPMVVKRYKTCEFILHSPSLACCRVMLPCFVQPRVPLPAHSLGDCLARLPWVVPLSF